MSTLVRYWENATRRLVKLLVGTILVAVLMVSYVAASQLLFSLPQQPVNKPGTETVTNHTRNPENKTIIPNPPTTSATPTPTIKPNQNYNYKNLPKPEPPQYPPEVQLQMDNETVLLSAIRSLKPSGGGQITLENNLAIIGQDVYLPNNTILTGSNPQVTIFLSGKNLQIPPNAQNITIKDLTIDASTLGQRFSLVIGQNSSNILIDNVQFASQSSITSAYLLIGGNNVTVNRTTFNSATKAPTIELKGSNASIINSNSNGFSTYPLVNVVGGLININIINNSVINRPLFWANHAETPVKNILIENNTNYFPANTYGLLIRGGTGDNNPVSDENVTIKGNYIKALGLAWNAIAVYGLTRNAVVTNNTVDMSQSGHNAIGISSGINVIVTKNVVYGCTEFTEGGIEVESNPAHNRAVGYSENVTVADNIVYDSWWGIYVRVMIPTHPNWNGTILLSKNVTIENNLVYRCDVGVNLLHGENLTVRNNDIIANRLPFYVDPNNVFNYTVTGNIGYP